MMVMQYEGDNMSQYIKSDHNILRVRSHQLRLLNDIAQGLKDIHS